MPTNRGTRRHAPRTTGSKRCSACGGVKPRTEFGRDPYMADGRTSHCYACIAARSQRDRARDAALDPAGFRRLHTKRIEAKRRASTEAVFGYLLAHPCVDCGEADPVVLDFDHVRGRKSANVNRLLNGGGSLKRIFDEIAKCDVRCANCHRRKTAAEQGWYSYFGRDHEGEARAVVDAQRARLRQLRMAAAGQEPLLSVPDLAVPVRDVEPPERIPPLVGVAGRLNEQLRYQPRRFRCGQPVSVVVAFRVVDGVAVAEQVAFFDEHQEVPCG